GPGDSSAPPIATAKPPSSRTSTSPRLSRVEDALSAIRRAVSYARGRLDKGGVRERSRNAGRACWALHHAMEVRYAAETTLPGSDDPRDPPGPRGGGGGDVSRTAPALAAAWSGGRRPHRVRLVDAAR